ncbi:MAG: DUF2442 domain-containing protein [Candidatus Schekmanbacteria bacterium]|nr:DUF2442 domain-containing protein [Candidatus Schekmanbacteria bacterium]
MLTNSVFFRTVHVEPGGYGISWSDNLDLSEYELWNKGKDILHKYNECNK